MDIDTKRLERLDNPEEKVLFYCDQNEPSVMILRRKGENTLLSDRDDPTAPLVKETFVNTGERRIGIGKMGVISIYEYQRVTRWM